MDHSYFMEHEDIILRPVTHDDIEMLRQWRNKKSIREKFIYSDEISEESQEKWYKSYSDKPDDIMFIIKETNQLKKDVGAIALYNIDYLRSSAEYGRVMIGEEDAKSKGMAKKASEALLAFGFDVLKLDTIYLEVFADNENAVMMYKKLGFHIINEKKGINDVSLYFMQIDKQIKGGNND